MYIKELPENSGVYIFKDKKEVPIYVGKALNIRKRVKTHFHYKYSDPKEEVLIDKVKSVEAIKVDSDIESLILEANLIKKYKPIYNTQLKDDKDYLYIKITNESFPKVLAARERGLKGAIEFFGPFPSANRVRTTLKTLRKIFHYTTCKANQKRPCLQYHLGLCPGVCAGLISEEDYWKSIRKLILFLKGKKSLVLKTLERELQKTAKNLEFEKSQYVKKQIEALEYTTKPKSTFGYLDENVEKTRSQELSALVKVVNLDKSPARIECYDVSNLFGREATGSMVVFSKGYADKDQYRRFKIKSVRGINDTAMISEVLDRRFKNDWEKPDLIIIDGGKAQFNAAVAIVKEYGLRIPVISLAKRMEEIYTLDKPMPIRLPSNNDALKLVQRIRDEAHRFAISYHRKLRHKQFLSSEQK